MPASWSWSGRVSVVRRVCASPSSLGAVSQYHANGEISTEASGRPTLRPGQAGTWRDGQELAHSFLLE